MLSSTKLYQSATIRLFSTQISTATTSSNCPHISNINKQNSVAQAKPFKDIPSLSKYNLIRGFLPGGEFYNKELNDVFTDVRKKYGDIFIFPGVFGNKDIVCTFDPKDFALVFRTEGPWPFRDGLETFVYHRNVHRAELFDGIGAGLVNE